jgi:hypothetical protein
MTLSLVFSNQWVSRRRADAFVDGLIALVVRFHLKAEWHQRWNITQRCQSNAETHGQRTSGGIEERMASTLPPVFRPKIVPRS